MVVLDRRSRLIHQLNSTARHIWQGCDGRRTVGAIARTVEEAFAIDIGRAETDVARVIQQLEAARLVETRPEPIAPDRSHGARWASVEER
jgi:hypothetical protein